MRPLASQVQCANGADSSFYAGEERPSSQAKGLLQSLRPLPNRPVESGFQPAILFYSGSRALPEATMNEAFGLAGSTRQRRRLIVAPGSAGGTGPPPIIAG